MHSTSGYPQGCPKLVYGKGWASYKEAVRIRTRALQAQIIWIRLWQECHSASGRSGDQQITDLGQGWASNCKAPAGLGGIVPDHPSAVKGLAAPAGWAVVGEKSAGHPVARQPVRETGTGMQAVW